VIARRSLVLLALLVAACGGRPARGAGAAGAAVDEETAPTTVEATSGGGDADEYEVEQRRREVEARRQIVRTEERAPAAATTAASGAAARVDPDVAVPRPEPGPWREHEWAIAPAVPPRVLLATLELPPGDAFRPPATACQDVILYVREGQLEAIGTGIATADAPVTLYPGDAVRFGPEGDGTAVNVGSSSARTVMAVARRADAGPARIPAPEGDACSVAAAARDPLLRPNRVGSTATTPPLSAAGGRLEVRILLDPESSGAENGALSILDGAPDLVVPEHVHASSAEVLLVEEGDGTMRLGDREVPVRAGSAIYVPPGMLHSFRGAGTARLRAIQIYAPAGPEQRFRQ
jgi:putative monooxygenase